MLLKRFRMFMTVHSSSYATLYIASYVCRRHFVATRIPKLNTLFELRTKSGLRFYDSLESWLWEEANNILGKGNFPNDVAYSTCKRSRLRYNRQDAGVLWHSTAMLFIVRVWDSRWCRGPCSMRNAYTSCPSSCGLTEDSH